MQGGLDVVGSCGGCGCVYEGWFIVEGFWLLFWFFCKLANLGIRGLIVFINLRLLVNFQLIYSQIIINFRKKIINLVCQHFLQNTNRSSIL